MRTLADFKAGDPVVYVQSAGLIPEPEPQPGIVISVGKRYVFVRYVGMATGSKATRPEDLMTAEEVDMIAALAPEVPLEVRYESTYDPRTRHATLGDGDGNGW